MKKSTMIIGFLFILGIGAVAVFWQHMDGLERTAAEKARLSALADRQAHFEAMFNQVEDYAQANPLDFVGIRRQYAALLDKGLSTDMAQRVQERIKAVDRAKGQFETKIIDMIKNTAEQMAQSKSPEAAAAYLLHYDGLGAAETVEMRTALAADFQVHARARREREAARLDAARSARDMLFEQVAALVVQGDRKTALAAVQASVEDDVIQPERKQVDALLREMKALNDPTGMLMHSFQRDVGRSITLQTRSGPLKASVLDIDGKNIHVEYAIIKKGQALGTAKKTLTLRDLTGAEQRARLARSDDPAAALLLAYSAVRGGHAAKGAELLKSSSAVLAPAMLQAISKVETAPPPTRQKTISTREQSAAQAYRALLGMLRLSRPEAAPEQIKATLKNKRFTVHEAKRIRRAQTLFQQRYGETQYARAHAGQLDVMAAAVQRTRTGPAGAIEYRNHFYRLMKDPENWRDANRLCKSKHAHLVTITDNSEQQWIHKQFSDAGMFWIGATDEAQEGNWQWVTGEKFKFTNWAPGQPDNFENHENVCEMGADGGWNDIPSDARLPFVMEWDPE